MGLGPTNLGWQLASSRRRGPSDLSKQPSKPFGTLGRTLPAGYTEPVLGLDSDQLALKARVSMLELSTIYPTNSASGQVVCGILSELENLLADCQMPQPIGVVGQPSQVVAADGKVRLKLHIAFASKEDAEKTLDLVDGGTLLSSGMAIRLERTDGTRRGSSSSTARPCLACPWSTSSASCSG